MSHQLEKPPTREDELTIQGLKLFYAFLLAVPWLWLLSLTLFVVVTAVVYGQFPSYGQPDPKELPLLYWPTFLLLLSTLASFPIWGMMTLFSLRPIFPINPTRRQIASYILGLLLAFFVLFNDVAGLMTWFLD